MSLREAWIARPDRERRAIAIGAGGVGVALIVALAWLPLERDRARMAAELPRLRATVATLERDAEAVQRVKTMTARAAAPATSLAALAGGATLPAGAQAGLVDERRLRLAAADVGFAALLDWLNAVQASHGLRVESAKLEALPAAGRVRAELVLARS